MFFWKKRTEDLKIENPEADVLYAPISGKVIPLEQVDDMVFSQKMMGEGDRHGLPVPTRHRGVGRH